MIDNPFLEDYLFMKKGISNISQLSYRELVYQKDNKLLIAEFVQTVKNYPLNAFTNSREIHEKKVQKFKLAHSI